MGYEQFADGYEYTKMLKDRIKERVDHTLTLQEAVDYIRFYGLRNLFNASGNIGFVGQVAIDVLDRALSYDKINVSEVPEETFEDLKLAKQYLSELINIVDSFGLDDIYGCGQHDYACKNCQYFSEHLNHGLCENEEFFVWKHKQDAIDLINKVEK